MKRVALDTKKFCVSRFQAILSEGGLYAFQILAREIADDGSFGDSATTDVTIVVTDQGPNYC